MKIVQIRDFKNDKKDFYIKRSSEIILMISTHDQICQLK